MRAPNGSLPQAVDTIALNFAEHTESLKILGSALLDLLQTALISDLIPQKRYNSDFTGVSQIICTDTCNSRLAVVSVNTLYAD